MRKPFWRAAGFVAAGAVLGTLAGQLLAHQVPLLARTTQVNWHPAADLGVLRYTLDLTLRVNGLTLVGVVAGYLVARRSR
ncbi:DUF4321 domain-containing protein [Alicyclobacillus sp.]|uniref:DUF4321 domain-containing protein n=1 Tax=Alicyclobacillus sp. TaxID=61169 RepID=UPI0025B998A5|nr:DUF4321 domain-containing protein [Alicyclobacillus sp.]MCL6516153.1 DUF4321 domain-containing protein [Alicyclobacillus sp.]